MQFLVRFFWTCLPYSKQYSILPYHCRHQFAQVANTNNLDTCDWMMLSPVNKSRRWKISDWSMWIHSTQISRKSAQSSNSTCKFVNPLRIGLCCWICEFQIHVVQFLIWKESMNFENFLSIISAKKIRKSCATLILAIAWIDQPFSFALAWISIVFQWLLP